MRSFSALIDFLMSLMRDEDVRAAFDRDPEATLASNGLDGVTEQDIRDARLAMADSGPAKVSPGDLPHARPAEPAREIHHTTNNYEVDNVEQNVNLFDVDVDDRDTVVVDSFNSADTNNVVAIQDNSRTDVDVLNVDDSFNDKADDEPVDDEPLLEEPAPAEAVEETTFAEEPADEEPIEPDLDPVA